MNAITIKDLISTYEHKSGYQRKYKLSDNKQKKCVLKTISSKRFYLHTVWSFTEKKNVDCTLKVVLIDRLIKFELEDHSKFYLPPLEK